MSSEARPGEHRLIMLATQGAEMRELRVQVLPRVRVQAQPRKLSETESQSKALRKVQHGESPVWNHSPSMS